VLLQQNNHSDCSSDQDKIWSHFQNRHLETFEGAKPRIDYLIKTIQGNKGKFVPRILNIGAGNGYFEEKSRTMGFDIFTLDPDKNTIKRLLGKGVKAHIGYIEQIHFDDFSFDFVVASEVLEHLSDEQLYKGIQEVFRILDQFGWFLGTVPYCEDMSLNQVVCPNCEKAFHRWGHKRSFDVKTLHNDLAPYFNKISLKKKVFIDLKERSLSGKIKGLIRMVLASYGVAIASPSIFFIGQKKM